jgi:predicted dehydrogenase
MKKLKVGIVGAGNIAVNAHLPAYKLCKNAEVTAIADINPERAKAAADKFGIPNVFLSAEEMIAKTDIEAIDVCVWNNAHCDVTITAARSGKHVLCEKPMAMNLEQALIMRDEIKKAGIIFMLAVPGRFAYANTLARELFDKGELGDVYFAKTAYVRQRGTPTGWFTDKKTSGGGPVIDIGVHRIDAAWYLMGNPKPVRVSAALSHNIGDYKTKGVDRWTGTSCPDNRFDTEDSGAGVIHFENGAVLLFEASWAINGPEHTDTQICGSKAGIILEPLTVYGERNGYLSTDALTVSKNENRFLNEITHFADCVLNKKETKFPPEQAVELQKMLQGIYDSARVGKEVVL